PWPRDAPGPRRRRERPHNRRWRPPRSAPARRGDGSRRPRRGDGPSLERSDTSPSSAPRSFDWGPASPRPAPSHAQPDAGPASSAPPPSPHFLSACWSAVAPGEEQSSSDGDEDGRYQEEAEHEAHDP